VTQAALTSPAAVPGTARPSAAAAGGVRPRGGGATPVGLVLAGALSVQFGAAVAATLFPRAGVAGVLSMRLALAAVLLLAVSRPRLRGHDRRGWAAVIAFGAVLAGMNASFYAAIDRIPLGAAVTLEFLGPLVLSVLAARRALSWLWAGLALAGVVLLGQGGLAGLGPAGAGFALVAGVGWAAYILLSAEVGRRFPRLDGLALAMVVATVLTLPFGVVGAGGALLHPAVLGTGLAVAALSSLVPYTLELLALRRLAAATFAVLTSLGPAIAALAGFVVLGQALSPVDAVAVVLVVTAGVGAVRSGRPYPGAAGRGPRAMRRPGRRRLPVRAHRTASCARRRRRSAADR
jgi:inner membrane transporter RhtA